MFKGLRGFSKVLLKDSKVSVKLRFVGFSCASIHLNLRFLKVSQRRQADALVSWAAQR